MQTVGEGRSIEEQTIFEDQSYWQDNVNSPAMIWLAQGKRGQPKTPSEFLATTDVPGGEELSSETGDGGCEGHQCRCELSHQETTGQQGQKRGEKEKDQERQRRVGKVKTRKKFRKQTKRKGQNRRRRTNSLQLECRGKVKRAHNLCAKCQSPCRTPVVSMSGEGWLIFKVKCGGDREGDRPAGEGPSGSKGEGQGNQSLDLRRKLKPYDEKPADLTDFQTEEQYMAERKFVFLHHFSGKEDVLGNAMKKAALANKINLEVIGVDKENNAGDLMAAEPYESDYKMAVNGDAGWPCTTYSRLRWRSQEGMLGPV